MVSNSDLITRRAIKAARRRARANAEGNMVSEVLITRGDPATLDGDGMLTADTNPVVVYAGKARLAKATGPVTYTIGDEVQFFSSGTVTVPLTWTTQDAEGVVTEQPVWVQVNDLLEVTGADDPLFAGRHFRIVDVEMNGLLDGARRLQIVGVARYPGWIDSAVRHPALSGSLDEVPPEWRV